MKLLKQIILISGLLISQLLAVGEAGAIFLLIAPGAGPAGTGEAQVAKADDAYASFYNPAGLGFLTGTEGVGMHVNWLPNLADDLYYEFMAYRKEYPGLGTFAGHIIYLNLGKQIATDDRGNVLGDFPSWMGAFTGSFGTTLTPSSSIGISFKVFHQALAPFGAGIEDDDGSSTDFAFDLGYMKKWKKINFGVALTNIGPPIDFIDAAQADPAPTNMRIGIFANVYNDGFNKMNILFDANKIMVTRYPAMDWNGDGFIQGDREESHDDPWYLAIFTAWLDDWYFGGDLDIDGDSHIGGYDCDGEIINESLDQYSCDGDWFETTELNFNDENYGIYSQAYDQDKAKIEKGTGAERSFTTELEEMIYNLGLEYWYTDNFCLRAGYIYDYEGKVINPTFGAGIRLLQYGFDFGYTAGEQGHPRANTMFFSINMEL